MTLRKLSLSLLAGAALALGVGPSLRADVPRERTDSAARPAGDASAPNWPTRRGPTRDNISHDTGLLKQWPKDGPPLAWESKGLGAGYSGVSVADGHIYTLGTQPGQTLLICLDLNGKKLWTSSVGAGDVGDSNYPGPRSTPTVDGDHIYVLDEVGHLACFTTVGKPVWHLNLKSDLGGAMMSGWGYAESPLVDGDLVLCTPGGPRGSVAALDKQTGKLRWRSKDLTDPAAYCSLVPATIGGTRQYVVMTNNHVAGINAADGAVLWSANRKGRTAVIPTPIVHDDIVFVTSEYGVGCNCYQITGSGPNLKAKELYHNTDMMVKHGGVVLVDGYLYGITTKKRGLLTCMALKDGKVAWTDKAVEALGSVSYADGMLYVRSEKGTVLLVEATPSGYHEHGRFEQPDRSDRNSWSHPVITGGKLYLRDQGVLLCYNVRGQ